jgi:hypothetical protein
MCRSPSALVGRKKLQTQLETVEKSEGAGCVHDRRIKNRLSHVCDGSGYHLISTMSRRDGPEDAGDAFCGWCDLDDGG